MMGYKYTKMRLFIDALCKKLCETKVGFFDVEKNNF